MSRYPYTEACDAMRMQTVDKFDTVKGVDLSRADASRIRQFIASAIGMDDHDLACRIADYARQETRHGE